MDDELFSTTKVPPKVWNARTGAPHDSVWVDRRSPYGNPFRIGKDGMTRDEVIDRFENEVLPFLDVSALRGKDIKCWCHPKRCHGDSILRKANS